MPEEDKKEQLEKLKKELAKLDWEEKLLRKRDDRLKWEQDMLQMEDGIRVRGYQALDAPGQDKDAPQEKPPEKPAEPAVAQELEPGSTYICLEQMPQKSVEMYIAEVGKGMKGLYITRSNPSQVRKNFKLGDSKICWLTGVKASEDVQSISGLQELSILVSNTIDENPKSVIFLDGIEYLISNNDFPIVLRLVQQIRDKVSTSESKMIIPINPNALEPRQMTLLQRECRILK